MTVIDNPSVRLFVAGETWQGLGRREGIFAVIENQSPEFLFGEAPNGHMEAISAALAAEDARYDRVYNQFDSSYARELPEDDSRLAEIFASYGISSIRELVGAKALYYQFDQEDIGSCGPAEATEFLLRTIREETREGRTVKLEIYGQPTNHIDHLDDAVENLVRDTIATLPEGKGPLEISSDAVYIRLGYTL